jgi:plastocyanin
VVIHDFAFDPGQLRVATGTTVTWTNLDEPGRTWTNLDEPGRTWTNLDEPGRTWTNLDEAAHTVTFRNGMAASGLLQQGQTYQCSFRSPGSFEYYCTVHRRMVGTVLVIAG